MTAAAVPPPLPGRRRALWWGIASLGFGGLALLLLLVCLLIGLGSLLHTIFPLLLLSPPTAEWLARSEGWMAIAGLSSKAAVGCMCAGLVLGAIGRRWPDPGRTLAFTGLCGNGLGLLGIGLLWLMDALGR